MHYKTAIFDDQLHFQIASHSSHISITTELSIHFYFIASFSSTRANRKGGRNPPFLLLIRYAMTKLLEAQRPIST